MAEAPLPLEIIESSRVAPLPGTTPDRASLPFTYFDVFWLNLQPVQRLFFYRYPHSTSHFLSSLLPSLKSSLSSALKTYYPLAASFRLTPGTDNRLEHCYVEGDAVCFTVAECNRQFEDLSGDNERDVLQLSCLAPELPKSDDVQPVFSVQVTVFPNQGIVIGTAVHHTLCDGSSSVQFMHTWAEICSSGASAPRPLPILDRTVISDPTDHYTFFYKVVRGKRKVTPRGDDLADKPSDLILATFRLGQEQIQKLKQEVLAKAAERNTSFHCSTIVITYAYVWTGFVRAKRIDSTKKVCLGIPAEFRSRVQPPVPKEYFGNCIGPCMPITHASDLMQEDGFITAAEVVGKAVDQLGECSEVPRDWMDKLTTMAVLTVAGSPKFKVYDVDFGIGRPTKVEILSATKTGAFAMADSRDEQGGVEIGIAFPRDEMDCFKKYFFDGLKHLSK